MIILFDPSTVGHGVIYCCIGIPTAYFMNTIMVKLFGPAMDSLFKKGVIVSKEVLIFTSAVILIMYAISHYRQKRQHKEIIVQETIDEEQDYINVPEPWEVPLMMLSSSNKALTMKDSEFSIAATIVFFALFVLRCFVIEILPSLLQFCLMAVFYASAIIVIVQYIKLLNKKAVTQSLFGIFKSLSLGVIILLGFAFIL